MNNIPNRFPTKIVDRFLVAMSDFYVPVIQIEMEFDYFLDEQRLAKAIELIMDAEPILGCRFTPRFFRPFWERVDKRRLSVLTITHD